MRQPATYAKLYALVVLGAFSVASLAILLYVSVTRDFLPGKVELSAAFAVGTVLAIAALAGAVRWRPLLDGIGNIRPATLVLAAAGVTVLLTGALLAAAFASFPWPVALLVSVLLILAAAGTQGGTARRA